MKKLFTFISKKDGHGLLRKIARIFKVIHIVLACLFGLISIINGIVLTDEAEGYIFLFLIIGAVGFFFILFMGLVIETILVSFSNITENQYEELVIKNKAEEINQKEQSNAYEKLRQLNDLKNSGIISEEEYDEKKKDILRHL